MNRLRRILNWTPESHMIIQRKGKFEVHTRVFFLPWRNHLDDEGFSLKFNTSKEAKEYLERYKGKFLRI